MNKSVGKEPITSRTNLVLHNEEDMHDIVALYSHNYDRIIVWGVAMALT